MLDQVINADTLVPVSVAILGVTGVSTLIWRVSAKTTEILHRLDSMDDKLDNHWTRTDQLEWAVQLRDENPELNVPLPHSKHSDSHE